MFTLISWAFPSFVAEQAFHLFQRIQKPGIRDREQAFYQQTHHGWVGEVLYYTCGNLAGKLGSGEISGYVINRLKRKGRRG